MLQEAEAGKYSRDRANVVGHQSIRSAMMLMKKLGDA